jgi:hypothetical protein
LEIAAAAGDEGNDHSEHPRRAITVGLEKREHAFFAVQV